MGQAAVATWWEERLRESSLDHRRQIVPTAAGPTHLLEAGQGRLTIVFLPGTNENAATSLPLLALLAAPKDHFLRGWGRATREAIVQLPVSRGHSDRALTPLR